MLAGKSALVTGASRGIGRAVALKLASLGAKVAINFAGNIAKATEVKEEIDANGGESILVQGNVADFETVQSIVKSVTENFGKIDILVNNA
ncbi:MAG: SDR family NAD(P)-dependent oxidoreductase, partial [Selenomonadaceae bacterium]|nr:SDR family NAD(P)-dependent oxidoreductase [Selenomonadaceae bacterium]